MTKDVEPANKLNSYHYDTNRSQFGPNSVKIWSNNRLVKLAVLKELSAADSAA